MVNFNNWTPRTTFTERVATIYGVDGGGRCDCTSGDASTGCSCFTHGNCNCFYTSDASGVALSGNEIMWHCGCRICPNISIDGLYYNAHNKTGAFEGQTSLQQFPFMNVPEEESDTGTWDGVHTSDLPCICARTQGHLCTTCDVCACKL
tara:strand:- start:19900 stop:20346 length:447 start_codon:yes stop_codon:yes gene_type:complete